MATRSNGNGRSNGRSNGNGRAHAKANGSANGKGNGKANGKSNGKANGKANGAAHGRANGSSRSASPRPVPVRPGHPSESKQPRGTLIIIGGHEDKEHDKLILRAVAGRVGSGKLVLVTVASEVPDELWKDYQKVFGELGVKRIVHLHVDTRAEAKLEENHGVLDGATVVFLTGGEQLKLTSQLGDSPVYEKIHDIYMRGGTIAGTSAGASVMCETMLVSGGGSESHRIGSALRMAPGFGLIPGVIIDQHFAERGRIGRLTAAVAQNPRILGVGIDEDTAIVCDDKHCFSVLGAGAVYVVDGEDVTYTNLTDEESERTLSVFGVRLHILSMGDEFDMHTRQPSNRSAEDVEKELVGRN